MEKKAQERRQHKRVPARILIKYGNAEQFFTDYIQNISRGGIFVPTYNPLAQRHASAHQFFVAVLGWVHRDGGES